jgi:hypothetical protein
VTTAAAAAATTTAAIRINQCNFPQIIVNMFAK